MNKILLLDNYDSFTYNLYHLVQSNFTGEVIVKRDFELTNEDYSQYKAIIISPGPGRPETTPTAMKVIKANYTNKPILGVCLGMQCLNEFFNGKTIKSIKPVHGKIDKLKRLKKTILFNNLPETFSVARYHSLMIEPSDDFVITSTLEDRTIMSIEHNKLPLYGVQFHPESFLTEYGDSIIINFLKRITNE